MQTVQITTGCLIFISLPHILSVPKYLQVYTLVCVRVHSGALNSAEGLSKERWESSHRIASHPARPKRAHPRLAADLQ